MEGMACAYENCLITSFSEVESGRGELVLILAEVRISEALARNRGEALAVLVFGLLARDEAAVARIDDVLRLLRSLHSR